MQARHGNVIEHFNFAKQLRRYNALLAGRAVSESDEGSGSVECTADIQHLTTAARKVCRISLSVFKFIHMEASRVHGHGRKT